MCMCIYTHTTHNCTHTYIHVFTYILACIQIHIHTKYVFFQCPFFQCLLRMSLTE